MINHTFKNYFHIIYYIKYPHHFNLKILQLISVILYLLPLHYFIFSSHVNFKLNEFELIINLIV
jgi:hypothetical protein